MRRQKTGMSRMRKVIPMVAVIAVALATAGIAIAHGNGDVTSYADQENMAMGVSVSISPSGNSGANGATLTYTVTVNNTGTIDDNYTLSVTDSAGWSPNVLPTSLSVIAGSSDNTTALSMTAPSNATGGTIDNITVTATSQTDNTVSSSASCTAQATAENNTGNVSDNYSLQNETFGFPHCGHMGRGGFGFGYPIRVSEAFKENVMSIAKSDSDVQNLLNAGYENVYIQPIINATVQGNGDVTIKATGAIVALRNNENLALVQVGMETGKVTRIVEWTVIEKS